MERAVIVIKYNTRKDIQYALDRGVDYDLENAPSNISVTDGKQGSANYEMALLTSKNKKIAKEAIRAKTLLDTGIDLKSIEIFCKYLRKTGIEINSSDIEDFLDTRENK